MRRAIIISIAASGAVVAVSLVALRMVSGHMRAAVERGVLMAWPSSIILLGSQSPFDLAFLVAMAANALLYALLGTLVWAGARRRGFLLVFAAPVAFIWWWTWSL